MTYLSICIICYIAVALIKRTSIKNEWLPAISCGLGATLSLIAFAFFRQTAEIEPLAAIVSGAIAGLAATGSNQVLKQANKLIFDKYGLSIEDLDRMLEREQKSDHS